MTRLNSLAENGVSTLLDGLERDLDELKASIQTAGGSNVVYYFSDTGAAYDWSGILPQDISQPAGYGLAVLLVEVHGRSMKALYANIDITIAVGSTANIYHPDQALAAQLANTPSFFTGILPIPNDSPDPQLIRYSVEVHGNTTSTVYFKVYIQALDTVDITVTRIV